MPGSRTKAGDRLTTLERVVASVGGGLLLCIALALLVWPPEHRVALAQCQDASAGCIVSVDSDLSTFAAALAAMGALVALVGILGIRFNKFKVAGGELSQEYAEETEGYSEVSPVHNRLRLHSRSKAQAADDDAEDEDREPPRIDPERHLEIPEPPSGPVADSPILIEVERGLGVTLKAPALVPIATTRLARPIHDVDPLFLRDYQAARRATQHSFFMTHILGPAKTRGQTYSVAIRVSPHKDQDPWGVKSASFYLGRSWGSRVFDGKRGVDGRFGITTEAWGPFLALCEVEFDDGTRILLDHYCDFDMGSLLST